VNGAIGKRVTVASADSLQAAAISAAFGLGGIGYYPRSTGLVAKANPKDWQAACGGAD
jgi:hypothetical protein